MENTAAANCNIKTKFLTIISIKEYSIWVYYIILHNILQYYQSWRDHRLMLPDNMTSEYRLLPVDNHQLFASTSPNFHIYGLWGSWIWSKRLAQNRVFTRWSVIWKISVSFRNWWFAIKISSKLNGWWLNYFKLVVCNQNVCRLNGCQRSGDQIPSSRMPRVWPFRSVSIQ